MTAVIGKSSVVMNAEMARQTREDSESLQNTDNQSSQTSGSYVRKIAMKFTPPPDEITSPTTLLSAHRSRNLPASSCLHAGSLSESVQSRTMTVRMVSTASNCSHNMIDFSASNKVRTCTPPPVRTRIRSRSSEPLIVPPKPSDAKNQPFLGTELVSSRKFSDPSIMLPKSSDAKNGPLPGIALVSSNRLDSDPLIARPTSSDDSSKASPAVRLVDGLKSPSTTVLQHTCIEPPDAGCDVVTTVICSTATLKLSTSYDERVETGHAGASG